MKRIIAYPLLLITAIVLDRVAISMSQIDPKQSLRSLFVLLFLGILTSLIIQHFIRDWHRTDFILFIFVVLFILYRPLYNIIVKNFPQQADYLGLALIPLLGLLYAIVISRKLWQYIGKPVQVTYYLNLVCVFLLVFQTIQL